jgi:hypothetical protein
MPTEYIAYPVHMKESGPVTFSNFEVDTESLSSIYLDYAYAIATSDAEMIVLEFIPSGYPERVRVGPFGELVNFNPELDEQSKRDIVAAKLGKRIFLPCMDNA